MRLGQLKLARFKVFEHARIDFAPLTVLIGKNNAGKSSLLHALALLSQSAAIDGLQPSYPLDLGQDPATWCTRAARRRLRPAEARPGCDPLRLRGGRRATGSERTRSGGRGSAQLLRGQRRRAETIHRAPLEAVTRVVVDEGLWILALAAEATSNRPRDERAPAEQRLATAGLLQTLRVNTVWV